MAEESVWSGEWLCRYTLTCHQLGATESGREGRDRQTDKQTDRDTSIPAGRLIALVGIATVLDADKPSRDAWQLRPH